LDLPTDLGEDRWVTAWEFKPGNRSIIEQAVLWIGQATPSRGTVSGNGVSTPAARIGSWTPPEAAIVYPSEVAQSLPAGSRLVLELRYRKSATPQTDQSAVALYFGSRPRRELRHRLLACGTSMIDRSVDALAVTPRASGAGESIEIVAQRPDRTVEALAVVPRYQPEYPISYRFRKAVRLPSGTALHLRSSSPNCAADLDFVARQ
jgi:hypothetical protein